MCGTRNGDGKVGRGTISHSKRPGLCIGGPPTATSACGLTLDPAKLNSSLPKLQVPWKDRQRNNSCSSQPRATKLYLRHVLQVTPHHKTSLHFYYLSASPQVTKSHPIASAPPSTSAQHARQTVEAVPQAHGQISEVLQLSRALPGPSRCRNGQRCCRLQHESPSLPRAHTAWQDQAE